MDNKTIDETTALSATAPQASYAYKPALLGTSWQFCLASDAIEWTAGARGGRVRYADIRRVRLSFRPMSTQTHRFVAEIWPIRGAKLQVVSTSWRSMFEQERQDAAYSAFVLDLHRRLAAAQSDASFDSGLPALRYWPGLVIFAAVALAMAALTVQALAIGVWAGAAVVAGLLALSLWQAGGYFKRNRPGSYRADAPPQNLLP
jgi:hypothetical protein